VRDWVSRAPTLTKFVMFVKIQRASPLRQRALDLFASSTKFDSGTGWPSFWGSSEERRRNQARHFLRGAAQGGGAGGHLGHVFDDGPQPTGLRYCINGVVLTSWRALNILLFAFSS
jgi:peptide methionine sulfoxide reductase MsrB